MTHIPDIGRQACHVGNDQLITTDNYTQAGDLHAHYTVEEINCRSISYAPTQEVGIINHYALKDKNIKVLCFSWNTDKIPLCDQYYPNNRNKHYRQKLWYQDECYNPLFFENIKTKIVDTIPDLVVISTEGDLESGTFFHSQFLRVQMKTLGYKLLNNSKVNNIGINDTLRLSIYSRNRNFSLEHINNSLFSYNEEYTCYQKQTKTGLKSKAIVKYVNTRIGIIAFMAIQMPHQYIQGQVNRCLQEMQNDLLNDQVSYIFILGDFNLTPSLDTDGESLKTYYYHKTPSLEDYEEGRYIRPNYRLKSINDSQIDDYQSFNDPRFNSQLFNDRYDKMTWHNRIYYRSMPLASHDISALHYETLFEFPMLLKGKGEHLGVIGIYEFRQHRPHNPQIIDQSNIEDLENRNYLGEDELEDDESI